MSESLADALTIRYYLDIFDGDEHVVTSDGLNLFLKKLSAREIIDLDNRLGGNQVYTRISRWCLMENLVRHAIDTKSLTRLLSILFDGIDSNNLDVKSYSENKMYAVESMIRAINVDLSKKGFELIITDGNEVTVRDVRGVVISFESSFLSNYKKIDKVMRECISDFNNGCHEDSLTKSRTLLEAMIIKALDKKGHHIEKVDNLVDAFNEFLRAYDEELHLYDGEGRTVELMKNLRGIVYQIGYYRNNHSSSHYSECNLKPHVVRLALNSAMTIIQFISDVCENEQSGNNHSLDYVEV